METKNILIGGGILAAVIYFATKSKKGTPATEELSSEPEGGSMGGGFMGGGFPAPIAPAPINVGAANPPTKPPNNSYKCPTGYIWDFSNRKCVPMAVVKEAPTTALKDAYTSAKTAASGLSPNTTGTYNSPVGTVGGNVQSGTTYTPSSKLPTGTVGGAVQGSSNIYMSPVGQVGGNVVVGFSGKAPLTLDNLLC